LSYEYCGIPYIGKTARRDIRDSCYSPKRRTGKSKADIWFGEKNFVPCQLGVVKWEEKTGVVVSRCIIYAHVSSIRWIAPELAMDPIGHRWIQWKSVDINAMDSVHGIALSPFRKYVGGLEVVYNLISSPSTGITSLGMVFIFGT